VIVELAWPTLFHKIPQSRIPREFQNFKNYDILVLIFGRKIRRKTEWGKISLSYVDDIRDNNSGEDLKFVSLEETSIKGIKALKERVKEITRN